MRQDKSMSNNEVAIYYNKKPLLGRNNSYKRWGLFFLLFFVFKICFAADLMEIYGESLMTDPKYLEAYNKFRAQTQSVPAAWSKLLPQLNLTGNVARNKQNAVVPIINGKPFILPNQLVNYNSSQFSLSLSQAVFNFQAWAQVQEAKSTVKQAQAEFNAATQDLIFRVASAYFNVLDANDTLRYTQENKRANSRLLNQSQKQFAVGFATITAVYEAQAAFDAAVAQEQEDKGVLLTKVVELRRFTKRLYPNLNPLDTKHLPLITPKPNYEPKWERIAIQQNYTFLASRYAFEAARHNIQVAATGAFPTLSMQLNGTDANNSVASSSLNTPQFAGTTKSASLVLNFPAFQGGLVVAQTRQAQYNFKVAADLMEQTYRDVLIKTQNSFILINNGVKKIVADRRAVKSGQNSVTSTEKQLIAGTRTVIDVVNQQQRLYQRQVTLAHDQYSYLLALVSLKQAAGTLSPTDVYLLNGWLSRKSVKVLISPDLFLGDSRQEHTKFQDNF